MTHARLLWAQYISDLVIELAKQFRSCGYVHLENIAKNWKMSDKVISRCTSSDTDQPGQRGAFEPPGGGQGWSNHCWRFWIKSQWVDLIYLEAQMSFPKSIIQHLLSQELLTMWWTCSVAVAAGSMIFNITYWSSKSMNDQYWHMCVHCAHILDTLKIKIFQILWCEDLCPGHTASLQADHQDPVQD